MAEPVPGLAEFVSARLAEDEHVARMAAEDASAGLSWHVEARYQHSGSAGIFGEGGEAIVSDEGFPSQMEADHIARHDPARVLREVEAKRAILESECSPYPKHAPPTTVTMKLLASVYSDHPDYRAEWAPQ